MVSHELLEDVRKYIEAHFEPLVMEAAMPMISGVNGLASRPKKFGKKLAAKRCEEAAAECAAFCEDAAVPPDLAARLLEKDESFSEYVIRMIDACGMTDAECYTKAHLTRQLFNKLKNGKDYRPGKTTAIALGFALGLERPDFDEMLRKAGFSLSRSSEFDLIVEYCIEHGIYVIDDINELLFSFDQALLGSV